MIDIYLFIGVFFGLCYIIFYTKYKGLGELEKVGTLVISIALALIYILGVLLWPLVIIEFAIYIAKKNKEEIE